MTWFCVQPGGGLGEPNMGHDSRIESGSRHNWISCGQNEGSRLHHLSNHQGCITCSTRAGLSNQEVYKCRETTHYCSVGHCLNHLN